MQCRQGTHSPHTPRLPPPPYPPSAGSLDCPPSPPSPSLFFPLPTRLCFKTLPAFFYFLLLLASLNARFSPIHCATAHDHKPRPRHTTASEQAITILTLRSTHRGTHTLSLRSLVFRHWFLYLVANYFNPPPSPHPESRDSFSPVSVLTSQQLVTTNQPFPSSLPLHFLCQYTWKFVFFFFLFLFSYLLVYYLYMFRLESVHQLPPELGLRLPTFAT